jgi:hypothetical protein
MKARTEPGAWRPWGITLGLGVRPETPILRKGWQIGAGRWAIALASAAGELSTKDTNSHENTQG